MALNGVTRSAMFDGLRRRLGFGLPANAGERGEQLAADWLRRERGYRILARNWRDPRDRRHELDLVCRDGEALVFVEVKARAAGALVPGYYAVDRSKKQVMRRAIDAYLGLLKLPPRTFRFDVVEVTLASDAGSPAVLHFENVTLFPKHHRGSLGNESGR